MSTLQFSNAVLRRSINLALAALLCVPLAVLNADNPKLTTRSQTGCIRQTRGRSQAHDDRGQACYDDRGQACYDDRDQNLGAHNERSARRALNQFPAWRGWFQSRSCRRFISRPRRRNCDPNKKRRRNPPRRWRPR